MAVALAFVSGALSPTIEVGLYYTDYNIIIQLYILQTGKLYIPKLLVERNSKKIIETQ